MTDVRLTQKPIIKFRPYNKYNYLFFISEFSIRNALLFFFTKLGLKKLTFSKSKENLMLEIAEKEKKSRRKRYAICIMTYHHESLGNPAYIATMLYSIKKICIDKDGFPPFLIYANSEDSLEIQFGKTPDIRAMTIRAAIKNGLKGIVIGNLDDPETAKLFEEKIIDIIEDDELAKMTPFERHLRKIINRAYGYINKIAYSKEEKEEHINKAISLFEEILKQSKNNCEALLGKAIACSSSSEPDKVHKGCELFIKLNVVSEDMEEVHEMHSVACYKMGNFAKTKEDRHKWLLNGVHSLDSIVTWRINEYKSIKKVQHDYDNPELKKQLANKFAFMANSCAEVGGKYTSDAIKYYIQGIEMDATVESNYKCVHLMIKSAKKMSDYDEIIKVCAIARKKLPERGIEFLTNQAEAYFFAGKQTVATKLYNSINPIMTAEIEAWERDRKKRGKPGKKRADRITAFVTFLNHRAIYFRRIGSHNKSLNDLKKAISLDMDKTSYDIYFNLAKAMISFLNEGNCTDDFTLKDALNYLYTAIDIALNVNGLSTYEKLLKTIKEDLFFKRYIYDIKHFLDSSNYMVPIFLQKISPTFHGGEAN